MQPTHRETLPNGLRVVVAPMPHLHTATVAAFVKVGSRNESERDNGLSHFLEHMLFRGTERHPTAYDYNLAVEELGGTLSAATHVDFTMYGVSLPPESVLSGLAVFSEIFRAPIFSSIDTEKSILREEILEDLDEDGQDIDVDDLSRRLLFAPHPLGFTIPGAPSNVERFDIDDLRAHMHRYYGARNMVLCASGALVVDEVLERMRQCFGGLPPGTAADAEPPDMARRHDRFAHVTSQGSQTEMRLSFPTFGVHDSRMLALQVLSRVLDDGMSARLHRRISDELGLAYETFAGIDPYEDSGVLDIGVTVEHDKAPEALREMLAVLGQLRHEPVGRGELARVKRRYLWDLEATIDDDEAVAMYYGANALFGVTQTLESTADRLARIDADALQDVALALLAKGQAHLACVGVLEPRVQRELSDILSAFP